MNSHHRPTLTFLIALAAVTMIAGRVALSAAPAQPNVILIFADDMGWQDTHCSGHPYAKTPNIDRLAAEDTRFQQCCARIQSWSSRAAKAPGASATPIRHRTRR